MPPHLLRAPHEVGRLQDVLWTLGMRDHNGAGIVALGPQQVLLALNPHFDDCKIHLYDVEADGWLPVADIWNFNMKGLDDTRFHKEQRDIYLGHMTLGLWVRK